MTNKENYAQEKDYLLKKAILKSEFLAEEKNLKHQRVAIEKHVNRFHQTDKNYLNELLPEGVSKEHYEKIANLNERIGIDKNHTLTAFNRSEPCFGYDISNLINKLYIAGVKQLKPIYDSCCAYDFSKEDFSFETMIGKIISRTATENNLEKMKNNIDDYIKLCEERDAHQIKINTDPLSKK